MVTPIAVAVPDRILLLEQIHTSPGTWYVASEVANAFFSIDVHEAHQKQFAFNWLGQQYTYTVLPQRPINHPALCHNLVCRDLNQLSLPQDIIPAHYVDDTMLITSSESVIVTTLGSLARHLYTRGREINLTNIHSSVKFLGKLWSGSCQDITSEIKSKWYLALVQPRKKLNPQCDSLDLGGNIFLIWCATPNHLPSDLKRCYF